MYASSATQLSRLGITDNRILVSSGGVPVWSNTLPACTFGSTVTLNDQYFDAGSGYLSSLTTGATSGILFCNSAGTQQLFTLRHQSASAADWDYQTINFQSYNDNVSPETITYGALNFYSADISDGAEDGAFYIYLMNAGTDNNVLTLTGAGALGIDINSGITYADANHPVSVFDKYDDALVLREGIQMQALDKLVDIGVFSKKNTGSGYMMNIQPMTRLLAGGIYQNRAKIDSLDERLNRLELALPIGS